MGTLSGGNGGGWPPDELPDLPPEWGAIVIPDDASELAQEAARARRELRRQAREQRWRRRLHLPPAKPKRDSEQSLGVPLLVILIAMIATLTSLFVIAWPTPQPRLDPEPSAVATTPAGGPVTAHGIPAGGSPGASQPALPTPPGSAAPGAFSQPGPPQPQPPAAVAPPASG
jgi:hypothetical protein